MKFTSFSDAFPANSTITVAGDCHSELSLLLLDRSKDDELKDDFAKLYYFILKEKTCYAILTTYSW